MYCRSSRSNQLRNGTTVYDLFPVIFQRNSQEKIDGIIHHVNYNCSTRCQYRFLNLLDRQSILQTSQKENNNRIPFTLTFHPHNHAVKSIILKNFKLLQSDPDTDRIFSQLPLISFKRDKNIHNFLVRCAFQTGKQPGTLKCARARCKTCPFIYNVEKLPGPKRSIKITDHFTCTSANVIY